MSETPINSKGSPDDYPGAHPGADGDPVQIGQILPGILDAIEANTEPTDVTVARAELTRLIDTKERGSAYVSDEDLATAREELDRAIKEATNRRPPVD
jgi:hypothetical protein